MFKLIIYINWLQKARQQAASCHHLRFDKNVQMSLPFFQSWPGFSSTWSYWKLLIGMIKGAAHASTTTN